MPKNTTSLAVSYEVSTGAHNFYCVAYHYEAVKCNTFFNGSPKMAVNGSEDAIITITVLLNCIDRNTLYAGVYEKPAEWRIAGGTEIRVLPEPKMIEVRK